MSKENQLTPEEITSVISEQPDLYEPTVQPLDAIQQNGYYPIELDEDNNQAITPSLAKLATPKSDRNWMERLKVSAKNAVSNIMNEQLTHNVALGNALVTIGDKEQVEYGRRMASEAKRHLDEIMDDTEQLTPEEAESWAAAIGSGSVSMVDFAANLALLRGLGAGKVGAEIGAGILAGIAGYEEGAISDVEKYIADTGDTELKNYKGDKKALTVNAASGAVQGGIEALTSGLGRYILNNPLSKKVLGTAGQNAIRKVMGSAVGRALAAGANESVNNAFEEWTQQLTGNLAEIVKGNKEFTVDNILQGAGQAAGVGALLGWMATPVMQEYGRRKTRDWVSDKLRKAADEKGIEISDAEIKKAANDLVGAIESKGVQQVTDNYEKINQITGAESDLAKTLSKAFEDLVNAGRVKFRGATEDEVRQAGLDWANWMQAQAILDSLDRGIALSEHPLNNAVAELDRIYLEGMNAGEGDLLTLDINNAQVQYLAEQIDDFIQKNQQSREQAEAARIEALREAELNARLEAVKELEQNAIAELEKARLEQNEEAIANLTLDLNMLTARVDSLTSELQGLIANRQQNTGRISIKQAKGLESPRKAPTQKIGDKYVSVDGKSTVKTETVKNRNGTEKEKITVTTPDGQSKQIFVSQQQDGSYLMWWTDDAEGKGQKQAYYDNDEWLSPDDAKKKFNKKLSGGQVDLSQMMESELGFTERNNLTADQVKQGLEKMGVRENDGGDSAAGGVLQFQDLPPQLQEQFRLAEENARMDEMYPEYTGETIVVDGKERTVYNSEGKRINKSAEALTNFWRWFGDSKVVDEQGRPLVVYHGTGNSFDTFDLSLSGRVFFSDMKAIADTYQGFRDPYSENKTTLSVYLKMENPYIVDFGGHSYVDTPSIDGNDFNDLDELIDYVDGKIYDGVIAKNIKDTADTSNWNLSRTVANDYIVFNNKQIKSVNNLGYYSSADDRLDYQIGYASMKGEMIGDYIDANKFGGTGEGQNVHGWGNYFLASKEKDKENYFNKFERQGPGLRYDGEELSGRALNRLGITYPETQSLILNRLGDLSITKAWLTKTLRTYLRNSENHYTNKIDNVVKQFTMLGEHTEEEIRAIIKDIETIAKGKGYSVGVLFGFPEDTEEGKAQAKYLKNEDSRELFKDVYNTLVDEFGGEDRLSSAVTMFERIIADLESQRKSLEAAKKLDFDKITGRTGLLYKGMQIKDYLEKYLDAPYMWRVKQDFYDAVRNAMALGKDPIKAIESLDFAQKQFDEKKLKADIEKRIAEKVDPKDKVLTSKIKGAFDAFLNSTDAGASMDSIMSGLGLTEYEKEIVNDITTDMDGEDYLTNKDGGWSPSIPNVFFSIREDKAMNETLKKAKELFKEAKKEDFEYKASASMYRSDDIPENKFLLDMSKSLEEQPSYVKDAIIKLYTETGVGIEPITWENIRLINPALPRIYNAKEILSDPKSEDFKSDKMRTINLYDGAVDRFIIRWRNRGLASAVEDVASWVKGLEQQRDEFKNYTNRSDFSQNVREANERAYLEEADMAEVLKFLYNKVSKIPKDAKIEDYVLVEPKILDNTTGKSYYHQLEESLGKEENKAIYDSLNAKTAHEAASKLLLRYGIRGVRYWGKSDHRGFVTFEPTPVTERIYQPVMAGDRTNANFWLAKQKALMDRAKEFYGTTDNIDESGYILPDGSLLDMSGANLGGSHTGKRVLDHRDISDAFEEESAEYSEGVGWIDFINAGAIRFQPESMDFGMAHIPTPEQIKTIERILLYNAQQVPLFQKEPGIQFLSDANEINESQDTFFQKVDVNTDAEQIKRLATAFFSGSGITPIMLDRMSFQNKKTSASKTGLGKEYRGAYDPLTRAILFSKVSDVTTLFHESAHYWFDRNLRYYKTGMASPEWKDRWEKVMEELGVVPNARGYVTAASVKAGSEKFARSMEAYLKTGEYENAAMQWAHQDYKNMVGRVYRNLWKNYWGLEDLSPAVKDWFNMNGFDVSNPMTAFAEKTTMDTAEEDIGNIVATDETKPDVPAVVQEEADAANGQVVENRKGEVAIVPEDQYETDKRVHSKLPESAERATGVEMEPIVFNRRSMSDSLRAARDLVDRDPVRAWEALKAGDDMIDGLYAGDIYRALISKYKEENNPTMIKTVVQSFANAARRAGRSVKAFDLETPTVSFEGTMSSLNKIFATKSNDAKVSELVKQIKNFLHEPDALNKGWEKFKKELECK